MCVFYFIHRHIEKKRERVGEARVEGVQKSKSKAPLCIDVDAVFLIPSVHCACVFIVCVFDTYKRAHLCPSMHSFMC